MKKVIRTILFPPVVLGFMMCNTGGNLSAKKFSWRKVYPKKSLITITPFEKKCVARLDSLFAVNVSEHEFNGSVLVAKRGRVLYKKLFGFQSKKPPKFLTDTSAFQIASTSKTFTATGILLLYEQGKIKLEDTLRKFFPELPYQKVTIKDLLSHRSGLPNYMYCLGDSCEESNDPLTNDEVINFLISARPERDSPPDRKFEYCNTNYMLLGSIIEKVTGMSYSNFMQKNIFEPLKMHHTRVISKAKDSLGANDTYGYEGKKWEQVEDDFLDGTVGDKGIYSTAYDMFLYERALTLGKLLSEETLKMAYTGYSHEKKGKRNYGLGWRIYERTKKETLIYHNGWWHGYTTAFVRRLSDQTVIIVLSNRFVKGSFYVYQVLNIMDGKDANAVVEEEE